MDQITITREEFRSAVADEIMTLMQASEKSNTSATAGAMAMMLVATFGAALTTRLFDKKEVEEDGADS